jgi:hypothetical protein
MLPEYLYEIIQASKQNLLLEQKLTESILSEKIDGWDLTQLFGLVKIFAEKGNKNAHENLYKAFSLSEYQDYQGIGLSEELIDLDGLDGLKFVAEVRGKKLLKSASDWEDDYLLTYTKDALPDSSPFVYLEGMAVDNQYIQTYLNKIKECKETRTDRSKVEWTYEFIKERIRKNHNLSGLRRWAKPDIMLRIAEDFINEKEIEIARKYLEAFRFYKFPLDFNHLIPFTKDSDEITRGYTLESLSFFKNSHVREIALTNLNHRVGIGDSLKILANNFEEYDCKLIEEILLEQNNSDEFHEVAWGVNDICEKNHSILLLNSLINLYTMGHCSICRKKPVELMLRDSTLPDWIREEAVYDCNFDIRELFIS